MDELIEALERAAGPDRGLDAGIHFVVRNGVGVGYRQDAPLYTSSIDAALTLVPEEESSNFEVCFEQHKRRKRTYWTAIIGHMHFDAWTAEAPTAALALCIAALRARQSLEESEPLQLRTAREIEQERLSRRQPAPPGDVVAEGGK